MGGVLVVAVTIATFLPVLQNDFVNWDDVANFVGNPYFRGLGWTNLRWMFTETHVGHYDPLTWVTHALDYLLPRNAHAHYYLGNWLNATERPQEARAEYERAFELADRADLKTASLNGVTESFRRMAGSLNSQGVAFAEKGELESAHRLFLEALRVFPRYPDACKNLRRLAGMIRVDAQELRNCPE